MLYKRAHFSSSPPGDALKSLLEDALNKRTKFGQRRLNITSDKEWDACRRRLHTSCTIPTSLLSF